jgi:alkanesulfonate monooxygenase SsuD/methylene tetrahydromethanopterin reductase-like flavin-dependent oxidoreductase (luciferase family)
VSDAASAASPAPTAGRPRFLFGVVRNQNVPLPELRRHWALYESLGFDSIWHADHYQRPSVPDHPFLEGWTLLAHLASVTTRVRLGLLVNSNTFRHPPLVAKMAVTVDHIARGRLELGLGTGWWEPEHRAYGVPFPGPKELVDRFEESVEVIHGLLTHETFSYDGRFYRLDEALFRPGPFAERIPLTLGAHGPRMLGIVARFADRWNSYGTVEEIRERNARLDEACAAIGRDPGEILRSLYGWTLKLGADPWSSPDAFADIVGRYAEVGIREFLMEAPHEHQFGTTERIATDVIPGLRA